jgi:hypothetical protein
MNFLSAMQLPHWLVVAGAVATSAGEMVATSGLASNAARLVVDDLTRVIACPTLSAGLQGWS